MKEIAEIQYTVDADRLMRMYYARYKVNYEKFSQEIYESRSENEREYRDTFFDDKVISENLVKNEKMTFLFNGLLSPPGAATVSFDFSSEGIPKIYAAIAAPIKAITTLATIKIKLEKS